MCIHNIHCERQHLSPNNVGHKKVIISFEFSFRNDVYYKLIVEIICMDKAGPCIHLGPTEAGLIATLIASTTSIRTVIKLGIQRGWPTND